MTRTTLRRFVPFAVALGAMVLVSLPAAAKGPRVAVKSLTANSVPDDIVALLTSQVCTELSKNKVDVLCADDLTALLQHAAIQQELASCEGDDCLKALGSAAKANFVVKGSVGKIDKTYVLTLQLIDAKTSAVKARVSERTDKKISDLLDKIPGMAKKLKP